MGRGANNEQNFLASHCPVARAPPQGQRGWRREAERARRLGTNPPLPTPPPLPPTPAGVAAPFPW